MRILLVEDNVPLADEISADLIRAAYAVDWLTDGRDALVQGAIENYDLAILDLGLPGKSGLEVLKAWRAQHITTPVLILTARDTWAEKIEGLKAGADDYLTKPFHPEELSLRIQALLRRTHGLHNAPQLDVLGVVLDEANQGVLLNNEHIRLTAAQFKLLRYLMMHPKRIISKSELNDHLYDDTTEHESNVLEVHVNHLRTKLGKTVIETRRGQGYVFHGISP